jgi:hypothetical protein
VPPVGPWRTAGPRQTVRVSLSGDRRAAASGNGGEQKIKPRMQAICGKCPPHRLILGNKPGHGCVEAYVPSGCRFILHHPLLLVSDEEEIVGGDKHPKRRSAARPAA